MEAQSSPSNTLNYQYQLSSTNAKLNTAAIFAFTPIIGAIGIHDFFIKKYKNGIIHISIILAGFFLYAILLSLAPILSVSTLLFQCLANTFRLAPFFISYIWAIVEGVRILRSKKAKPSSPPSYSVSTNISPNPPMPKQDKRRQNPTYSILSFIMSAFSLLVWIPAFIELFTYTGGMSGAGMILTIYYWSFGWILGILSIIFGILGLRTNYRELAIASLCIKGIIIGCLLLELLSIWL